METVQRDYGQYYSNLDPCEVCYAVWHIQRVARILWHPFICLELKCTRYHYIQEWNITRFRSVHLSVRQCMQTVIRFALSYTYNGMLHLQVLQQQAVIFRCLYICRSYIITSRKFKPWVFLWRISRPTKLASKRYSCHLLI